jgi:hypothetical protein
LQLLKDSMTSRFMLSICIILSLAACGGGGGESSTTNASSNSVPNGSASAPKSLSVDVANSIGSDAFYNNFKYVASTDERLIVRVNLVAPLSDTESARCGANPGTGANPSSYATQIHVYDSRGVRINGICGEDLTVAFPAAGTYALNFEFPSHGGGTFHAASLKGASPILFSDSGDGSPSRPKRLSTLNGNTISSNPFNDYFWVQAAQGETIVLAVQLQIPLTQIQKTRCGSGAEATNNAQMRVFDASLNQVAVLCGESLRFVAPATGTYVIQTDYGVNGGTLSALRL